jgi:spore germination cell wall hydrolase CwlJ-like protein
MAWRWDHSHNDRLTIEQIIGSDDQNEEPEAELPDPATLSFVERVDEVDAMPSAIPADEEWLAKAIYFEARNEPTEGQAAVAKVVLNRLDDPRWPKSIKAVVSEGEAKRNRCQFSFMCDGKPEHIKDKKAWKRALHIASEVLSNWRSGEDMGCAHSYRADYVTSTSALRWFATLRKEKQEGTHIFYCDKRS